MDQDLVEIYSPHGINDTDVFYALMIRAIATFVDASNQYRKDPSSLAELDEIPSLDGWSVERREDLDFPKVTLKTIYNGESKIEHI